MSDENKNANDPSLINKVIEFSAAIPPAAEKPDILQMVSQLQNEIVNHAAPAVPAVQVSNSSVVNQATSAPSGDQK